MMKNVKVLMYSIRRKSNCKVSWRLCHVHELSQGELT